MAPIRHSILWISSLVATATARCPGQFTAFLLQSEPQDRSRVLSVGGGVFGGYSAANGHAGIWASLSASFTDLNPGGAPNGGEVNAVVGQVQFGEFASRAAMWTGTAQSFVDLNPPGFDASTILGATTELQVGYTRAFATGYNEQAALWSGTAASAVSLHPQGAFASIAYATSGDRQGGFVQSNLPAYTHAVLWSGSAASMVDMNPGPGFNSIIYGMHGDQQVGYIDSLATGTRAAIWNGTPESLRDVHPFATGFSELQATCGTAQVGWYNNGSGVKAGIWFGTRESFIDLSRFLPPGAGNSLALCVEEHDGLFTVGGYARYNNIERPFVWVGVPSPSSTAPLLAAACFTTRRKRR